MSHLSSQALLLLLTKGKTAFNTEAHGKGVLLCKASPEAAPGPGQDSSQAASAAPAQRKPAKRAPK